MARKKEITIVGAGLAGMTAAVSLAGEGYAVTVIEAQKGYGGSASLHPSVHTTPAQLDELWEYLGFEIEGGFVRCDPYPVIYYGRKPLSMPPYVRYNTAYCTERGPRPSSLDRRLFDRARRAGVRFEFGRRIDFSCLKPGTIIASGLHPEGYDALGIPYRTMYGAWSCRETEDRSSSGNIYMGSFSTDYGYTARVNGLEYALLFSRKPVTEKDVVAFRKVLVATGQGRYPEPWKAVQTALPLEARLYAGECILAGTIAGMIEPFWGYGIVGALISGRLAAKAVTDRDGARAEFERFNRGYVKKLARREKVSSYSAPVRWALTRAGIAAVRIRCLFDRELASRPREPLTWFR